MINYLLDIIIYRRRNKILICQLTKAKIKVISMIKKEQVISYSQNNKIGKEYLHSIRLTQSQKNRDKRE